MINSNINIDNSSTSAVKAMVELYNGSTLVKTCTCSDVLQGFTLDRAGDNGKIFGFGICQKLKANLIDLERELTVTTSNTVEVGYEVGKVQEHPHPTFFVTEVNRNEDTNTISLTSYDALYTAGAHNIGEVTLSTPYTVRGVATAIATFLGLDGIEVVNVGATETCFDTSYTEGANLDGSEYIRDVLNAIAEVTQTIYYINNNNKLVFKRFNVDGVADFTITRDDYFSMHTQTNRRLTAICSATELGDNVTSSTGEIGTTQYVRDNPFWELREDIGTLLDAAIDAIGGLTINQFDCDWVGNFLVEIGDKIKLITEDGGSVFSYLINDTITFDGTLGQVTEWEYEDNEGETASNPTSLGEALNKTYARVDKAEKEIELVAAEADANTNDISALKINTDGISATVGSLKSATEEAVGTMNDNFETLSQQVSTKVSAEDVQITIESEMKKGVDKVQTSTGFTFDSEGLKVSKTGSEMKTQITEDGMKISRNEEETLVADNTGVKAENLHATTYLIIGNTSRFEDWNGRTGCFWIGG